MDREKGKGGRKMGEIWVSMYIYLGKFAGRVK